MCIALPMKLVEIVDAAAAEAGLPVFRAKCVPLEGVGDLIPSGGEQGEGANPAADLGTAQIVDVSMIETPAVGDLLMVFRGTALRRTDADEAGEVLAALGAVDRVMEGSVSEADLRAGFGDLMDREPELPEHLRRLVPGAKA